MEDGEVLGEAAGEAAERGQQQGAHTGRVTVWGATVEAINILTGYTHFYIVHMQSGGEMQRLLTMLSRTTRRVLHRGGWIIISR